VIRRQKEKARRKATRSFFYFLQYVWWQPWDLVIGKHTKAVAFAIDDAIEKFLDGESSYLDIEIPFRHGKSDLVSLALPAFILGFLHAQNPDVIMTGYGEDLIHGFSIKTKDIIRSKAYQEVFPNIRIQPGRDKVGQWGVMDSTGVVTATPLGGQIMGKGAHVLIIDDFLKGKAAARSGATRKLMDEAISDAINRLAPVHIVILCATSWHIDDPRQRIRKRMKEEQNYPQFEKLTFPAKIIDAKTGEWEGEYLFEGRYGKRWYEIQYATQQSWARALLDCEPTPDTGNIFDVEVYQIHDDIEDFPSGRYIRGWDLASSTKERVKDDPDYTVGGLGTVTKDEYGMEHLWIKDAIFGQWEAPTRDARIRAAAKKDGGSVRVFIEAFGAYKDAYTTLRQVLRGLRIVKKSRLPGDKLAKCAELEPIIEAGHLHMMRGKWNQKCLDQLKNFPEGHDDFCDMLAIVYHESKKRGGGAIPIA